MKNNLCVILSHFYVLRGQEEKFKTLEYVVDFYKKQGCTIVLSAHGEVPLPEALNKKIDFINWQQQVDHNEIGRGHPKFCIKGYEIAISAGYSKVMKCRAEDIIFNENLQNFLDQALADKKLIISEQTSFEHKIMGDLFHYGCVNYMKEIWSHHPWNYNYDGLKNLYHNTLSFHGGETEKVIKNILFLPVESLNWITVDDKLIDSGCNTENFWGLNKYAYFGGF